MKLFRRRYLNLAVGAAAFTSASQIAQAQTYPTRPVTIAAGSGADILAWILGARLTEVLGQHVIIENVGGVGGMTGTSRSAQQSKTREQHNESA